MAGRLWNVRLLTGMAYFRQSFGNTLNFEQILPKAHTTGDSHSHAGLFGMMVESIVRGRQEHMLPVMPELLD